MSTRAMYQFQDSPNEPTFTVYKHFDGYPEGAAGFFAGTLGHAWPLPRFEADDFAAAFIAANKTAPGRLPGDCGGNIRLVASGEAGAWRQTADIETASGGVRVQAFSVHCEDWENAGKPSTWSEEVIFDGQLVEFIATFSKKSKAA